MNEIVDGLFRITQRDFKTGAAGRLDLAKDPQGRTVVLKFLKEGGITENLDQFKREYQTLLKFSHPNVARVYHFGQYEGRFYIVYEFVEGEEARVATGGMKPEEMVPLFIQGLEGLEAIHKTGLLHRDIKSSNVMVTMDKKVKIVDFGLSAALDQINPKNICGSPPYMAPEMIFRKGIDPRSDLFSFGVLMYSCVAGGQYPFFMRDKATGMTDKKEMLKKLQGIVAVEGLPDKPSLCNIHCPEYLDRIILKSLAPDPDDRWPNARALIQALKTHHAEGYQETLEAKGSYLVPEENRHIGRQKEQKLLNDALEELLKGKQTINGAFWICGGEGTGKSHLLKKLKEKAEENVEKVSIHFLEIPKKNVEEFIQEENWMDEWIGLLNRHLADNNKPILVLIDNMDNAVDKKFKLEGEIKGLLSQLKQREEKPALFAGNQPVMICLTGCREVYPSLVSIGLKPFSKEEIRDYLLAIPALKGKTVPNKFLEALYNRTRGNPKEVCEVLKRQGKNITFGLGDEILISHVEDTSIDFGDEEEDMPTLTHRRLTGVLSELTPSELNILKVMAVWCWQGVLTSIPERDLKSLVSGTSFQNDLRPLTEKEIVIRDQKNDSCAFPEYSYLPSLVYKTVGACERQELHQRICEHIKNQPDALLFHQALGTSPTESLKALLRLERKFLYEGGRAEFVKQILKWKLLEVGAGNARLNTFLASRLIHACVYAGDYELALEFYKQAGQDNSISKSLKIILIVSILPVFIEQRQFEKADQVLKEALEFSKELKNDHWEIVLLNFRARIYYKKFFVEKEGNQRYLQEAKRIYGENEGREDERVRNNDLGLVLLALGDHKGTMETIQKELERLKKNPNVFMEMVALTHLADASRHLGDFERALAYGQKALEKAKKTGLGKWILYAHYILAGIYQNKGMALVAKGRNKDALGEFALALAENSSCLAASPCLEDRQEANTNTMGIFIRKGQCYQNLGEWNSAMTHFYAVLDYNPADFYRCQACLGLGECYTQKGDLQKARDFLQKAEEAMKTLPGYIVETYTFKIRLALARCCLKEKNFEKIVEYSREMRKLSEHHKELSDEYILFEKEWRQKDAGHRRTP